MRVLLDACVPKRLGKELTGHQVRTVPEMDWADRDDGPLLEVMTGHFDSGEILEEYPDDPRGESCLILGYAEGRPIHIVCGYTSTQSIRVITVYLPKFPKWVDEKTRRPKGAHNA